MKSAAWWPRRRSPISRLAVPRYTTTDGTIRETQRNIPSSREGLRDLQDSQRPDRARGIGVRVPDVRHAFCLDGLKVSTINLRGAMSDTLFPCTLVGSYPQPDWLIDKEVLRQAAFRRARARRSCGACPNRS